MSIRRSRVYSFPLFCSAAFGPHLVFFGRRLEEGSVPRLRQSFSLLETDDSAQEEEHGRRLTAFCSYITDWSWVRFVTFYSSTLVPCRRPETFSKGQTRGHALMLRASICSYSLTNLSLVYSNAFYCFLLFTVLSFVTVKHIVTLVLSIKFYLLSS